jgi:hypothetical protein
VVQVGIDRSRRNNKVIGEKKGGKEQRVISKDQPTMIPLYPVPPRVPSPSSSPPGHPSHLRHPTTSTRFKKKEGQILGHSRPPVILEIDQLLSASGGVGDVELHYKRL